MRPAGGLALEFGKGFVQRVRIERPESFVEEEGAELRRYQGGNGT
jgi:hypothetical protein